MADLDRESQRQDAAPRAAWQQASRTSTQDDSLTAGFEVNSPVAVVRTAVGGVLMGIANLIPGVSGGTMILAVGLYEEFIESVAEITALRFNLRRILFLCVLAAAAGTSILLLSSVILFLLFRFSALMFALFIGLTLGGAPLLFKMIGRFRSGTIVAALAGFGLMAGIALIKENESTSMPRNTTMDFASGVIGSVTMVLPGISGSYMLLVLDQYDRVIGAIADLKAGSFTALKILIPVGIGAVLGIVGLSNLLKILFRRWEKATLGFLLGMLIGSVLGLWPFGRQPTEKILSDRTDAELVAFATRHGIGEVADLSGPQLVEHILAGWSVRTASDYSATNIVGVIVMLLAGFVATVLLGRMGPQEENSVTAAGR